MQSGGCSLPQFCMMTHSPSVCRILVIAYSFSKKFSSHHSLAIVRAVGAQCTLSIPCRGELARQTRSQAISMMINVVCIALCGSHRLLIVEGKPPVVHQPWLLSMRQCDIREPWNRLWSSLMRLLTVYQRFKRPAHEWMCDNSSEEAFPGWARCCS
jgi:hypothetical protein